MQSKVTTVAAYLAALPADRRAALEAVRSVIKKNLDDDFEEGMQYGMIGYYVPHRVFPQGYHCDPKQPLPYAGLASQKGHMSLYLMGLYIGEGADTSELVRWFEGAWTKTGRKLDMGKACVRFKKLEDVPLDVIGEAIRKLPAKLYIARYIAATGGASAGPAKTAKTSPKTETAKKTAPKSASPAKAKPAPAKLAKKSPKSR